MMKLGVVRRAGFPHLKNDFEPAMTEIAKHTGVSFPFVAFLLIVGRRPGTVFAAKLREPMNGKTKVFVLHARRK